ncbi:MAG: hypothetical protein JSS32_00620 [Verrucomicrobia bacterium]|nr:hypothetical protein [Verrucomicrobiota bacterium]
MSSRSIVYYKPQLPPPLPQSHPLRPRGVEGWIDGHSPFDRPLARKIMQRVRHIEYGEFKTALLATIRHFNREIEKLPFGDRDYVVIALNNKSNGWVTDLALPHLTHLPSAILNWFDAEKTNFFLKHRNVKRVVIFDDAMYSGDQLRRLTASVTMEKENDSPDLSFKIYIAVPFMTYPSWASYEISRRYVKILQHNRIQTMETLFSPSERLDLQTQYGFSRHEQRTRGLTYFDHKVPDELTFPPFLVERSTGKDEQCMIEPIVDEFVPPYKDLSIPVE